MEHVQLDTRSVRVLMIVRTVLGQKIIMTAAIHRHVLSS